MTTVSLLGGDWEYQFEDEMDAGAVVGTRMLHHVSGTTIYTTNELYSAVVSATDEFQAMGFKNPMLPVTPNQFTMVNQAFIPRKSTEWLKEGTILADWTITSDPDTNGNGVYRVPYTDDGTSFVPGDIGMQVSQATTLDTGTLLDYEVEPDGTSILWIRPDDSGVGGDTFAGAGIITSEGTGVTGAVGTTTNGRCTYTAIQAIGSVPTATEVYIVQDRIKLGDWASPSNFQFWSTNQDAALGIISVLIRTETAGVAIAQQDLEVFARRYGALYDNFRLRVDAGGFSALPLASAPDVNNTTGYRSTGTMTLPTGTFVVGHAIYQGTSWVDATAKGIVTSVDANVIEYYLVGDLTDLSNTTVSYDYDFSSDTRGIYATTATIANTVGGPTEPGATKGGGVVITPGITTGDHDGNGVGESYSITIDCNAAPIAVVYERIKYVTRRGQDNSFWDTLVPDIDGEQYRGIEATIYYTGGASFTEGDNLTHSTLSNYTSVAMGVRSSITGQDVAQTYTTVADQQTSVPTLLNGHILQDENTDTIVINTGGAGGSIITHASIKGSPFGSFTGTTIFGAPGVLYKDFHADDTQAYILKDDLGETRTPPNTVTYTVANCLAGDRVLVARDTGTSGVIDKIQFSTMAAATKGDTTLTVTGTIDSEVPTGLSQGFVRVVDTSAQQEHKYWYDSRTTGAGGEFTLTTFAGNLGSVTGTTTSLIDDGADFVTENVEPGMLILQGDDEIYEVVSVTNSTTLVIKQVHGTGGTFTTQTYDINVAVVDYTTSDYIFDLIIDQEASGTEVSNTFVYSNTPFGTVIQVRHGGSIIPFTQNYTCSGDTTITTVRAVDSIA